MTLHTLSAIGAVIFAAAFIVMSAGTYWNSVTAVWAFRTGDKLGAAGYLACAAICGVGALCALQNM
jgi:hypothetical protein